MATLLFFSIARHAAPGNLGQPPRRSGFSTAGQPLSKVDQDRPFFQSITNLLRRSSSVPRQGDRRRAGVIDEIDLA